MQMTKLRKVYFLLDNPSGKDFSPRVFFEGSRLGEVKVKPSSAATTMSTEQIKLRNSLIAMAQRAGAEVIDPTIKLCKDQQCFRLKPEVGPLYRDTNHLRSSYTLDNADYLDKVLM